MCRYIYSVCTELMSIIPEGSAYSKYADYLTDNNISKNSVFPPTIWSNFRALICWTTNDCESFHPHFNEQFYKSHTHKHIFIKILISNVQNNVYIQINRYLYKLYQIVYSHIIMQSNCQTLNKYMCMSIKYCYLSIWFYAYD